MVNIKKMGIKNLALSLALVQALSLLPINNKLKLLDDDSDVMYPCASKGTINNNFTLKNGATVVFDKPINTNTETFYNNSNIYYNYSDPENPYYRRYNPETDDFDYISIFDIENSYNEQYGGNQQDFELHFDSLIRDKYIWNELQKYFPESYFGSHEQAMFFYKKYFKKIADNGCGYIAAINKVFMEFTGREQEFENTFGYPMYKVDSNGNIDFNYERLTLEFIDYSLFKKRLVARELLDSMAKDLALNELRLYSEDKAHKKLPDDFSSWKLSDWEKWNNSYKDNKWDELYNKWKNSENKEMNIAIQFTKSFGYLYAFLDQYNIAQTIDFYNITDGVYNTGDIVSSTGYRLYQENGNVVYENDEAHCVYVTDVTSDGRVVVSSWGEPYYFEDKNASNVSKLSLELHR